MKNILIINQYAANKGDRAVLFAIVSEMLKHDVKLTVSTHEPSLWNDYDFYESNGIDFVPWGWDFDKIINNGIISRLYWKTLSKLKKYTYTLNRELFLLPFKIPFFIQRLVMNPQFYQALKNADLVLSTGGHHITTLLAYDAISPQIYDISLALALAKPTYIWSQSLGPLDFHNNRNKRFVNNILNGCTEIYLRDTQSEKFIDRSDPRIKKTFESVFLLNSMFNEYVMPSKRDNVLGISIYSTKNRSDEETNDYIDILASVVNYANKKNIVVKFLPMEIKSSGPDDRPMIQKVLEKVDSIHMCSVLDEDLQTFEHLKEVSKCRYFIGHKTHSIIFALTTGTPLIALAYHPKSIDFMGQFDLDEFAIPDEKLTSKLLLKSFDSLTEHINEFGTMSFAKSDEMASVIQKDIENIVNLKV
ncbi:MAG: hypothetical protein COA79_15765 [Planctomycetota bacterium]|nr:MAG: hypothetical protein COA79_15765 [Planctomycetota bacterium]